MLTLALDPDQAQIRKGPQRHVPSTTVKPASMRERSVPTVPRPSLPERQTRTNILSPRVSALFPAVRWRSRGEGDTLEKHRTLPLVRGTYDRCDYLAEKRDAFEKPSALIERIVNPGEDNVIPLRRSPNGELPNCRLIV